MTSECKNNIFSTTAKLLNLPYFEMCVVCVCVFLKLLDTDHWSQNTNIRK